MIRVRCDKCGKKLKEQGALVFSPPEANEVLKFHICKSCYSLLCDFLEEEKCQK